MRERERENQCGSHKTESNKKLLFIKYVSVGTQFIVSQVYINVAYNKL